MFIEDLDFKSHISIKQLKYKSDDVKWVKFFNCKIPSDFSGKPEYQVISMVFPFQYKKSGEKFPLLIFYANFCMRTLNGS